MKARFSSRSPRALLFCSVSASGSTLPERARRFLPAVLAIALGFTILLGVRVFSTPRVAHGLHIGELSLSGLDRSELEAALQSLDARLRVTPLFVNVAGTPFELLPERIQFHIDVARTAARALGGAETRSLAARIGSWFSRWLTPEPVTPVVSFDAVRLEGELDGWERAAIADPPQEGGLRFDGERWRVTPARAGRRLDRTLAKTCIADALGAERSGTVELRTVLTEPRQDERAWEELRARAELLTGAPVELRAETFPGGWRVEPSVLRAALRAEPGPPPVLAFAKDALLPALAAVRSQLEHEARDARFEIDARDHVAVLPSQTGTRLEPEDVAQALLHAAQANDRIGVLPIRADAQPAFRTEDALALHIDHLMSEFHTFHACCQPRVQNIHRIADLLDNVLVRPGETFSLNARVGERTIKNGFVPAPSIQDGEMVDTVGGGVSQFATTFFNAVFYGGYDIIERQPHSYWFSRYPMGHEATLSWPKPDVIFRNDSDAGVLIKTSYTDKSIAVKLFGNNGGRIVKATVSPRREIVKPEVELLPNPELDVDEEKVKESGMEGWSVIVGRVLTFADGRKKSEQRKVTYKPRIRRVEVHPCRIPEGEPGYTGERCPEPKEDAGAPE